MSENFPNGWSYKKLNEILKMSKGKNPSNLFTENQAGYMPYVDIKAFEKGIVINYTDDEKCLFCNDGDILIVCDGSRSGLVGRAIKGAVGSTLAKISVDGVKNDFLYYFLLGKYQKLNTNVKGTGTPHVNPQLLKSFDFPIISVPEQERIVAKIEELFSELDKGVENLQTIKKQLKVYRQAVLKDAFAKSEKYEPLCNLAEMCLGKMLDVSKNKGEAHNYLRNINVRWFKFDLSNLLQMRFEEHETERYSIVKGDLIICEGGEPGRCAVWQSDEPLRIQKALHRIRVKEKLNATFLMYYFWFISQTGSIDKYFTGTTIKHLTGQSLKKIEVPILPVDEQDRIVIEIESRLSVCDKIEQTVDETQQKAESLRQSILKKAFEGKLVV